MLRTCIDVYPHQCMYHFLILDAHYSEGYKQEKAVQLCFSQILSNYPYCRWGFAGKQCHHTIGSILESSRYEMNI